MTRQIFLLAAIGIALLAACGKPPTKGETETAPAATPPETAVAPMTPAAEVPAGVRQLLPVDESASDASFAAYKAELVDIIARKDAQALLARVAPNIKNSFGGDDGIEAFKSGWKLDDPESEIWPTLGTILALGATKQSETTFAAPYVFTRWPEDLDSFSYLVVVKPGAALRSAPNPEGGLIRALGYEFLELGDYDEGAETGGFTAVKDQTGKAGYVAADDIRSPIAYRAFFEKRGGKWLMIFLVSGD